MRSAEDAQRRADQALIAAQDEAAEAPRAAAERDLAPGQSGSGNPPPDGNPRQRAGPRNVRPSEALASLTDGTALNECGSQRARRGRRGAQRRCAKRAPPSDGLTRDASQRAARLAAIAEERTRWDSRREAAARQIEEHTARRARDGRRADRARGRAGSDRRTSATPCSTPSPRPKPPATKPPTRAQQAEDHLAEADKAVKAADTALSAAREERARLQALSEAAEARIGELRDRIRDELDATPEELPERAEIKEGQELPALDHAESRVEKLKREREQLGGVNLRAEEEAAEHEERLTTLQADRDDLEGAIATSAPRHPEPEQGRPRTPDRIVRQGEQEFPGAVHQAVRRRRSQADLHRIGRPAAGRPGNLCPPAGQEAAVAGPSVGRRAGADGAWR